MRFRALATSCLLIAVSAGSVSTFAANPDCSRWIREYQDALAKRSAVAKRHVVRAARRLIVPRPRLLRASVPVHKKYTPRLTPAEMLKRFKILCGEDLPDDALPAEFIPTALETGLVQPAFPDASPLADAGDAPVLFTPASPVPAITPAAPVQIATTTIPTAPFTPLVPGVPLIPSTSTSTTGSTTGTSGTTGTTTTTTPTPAPTTPSPVPEPSTFVMLVTGGTLGIASVALRRRKHVS